MENDGKGKEMAKQERYEATKAEFIAWAAGRGWTPSKEIHRDFVLDADGTYGKLKADLGIPHRRSKAPDGRTQYEWDLGVVGA